MPLKSNSGKSFQGSIVLGKGFILTPEEAHKLIAKDSRNKEVLFPYLNGDDLNNSPTQKPSRWVINFFDWSEEKARSYPDCFDIVERLVKPERDSYDETKNSWNKSVKTNWWQFGAWRKALERAISELDQVMAINRNTKYLIIDFQNSRNIVFTDSIIIFSLSTFYDFGILSSSIHDAWAWKNSSTKGSATLRYSAGIAFEGFPFPDKSNIDNIKAIASKLNNLRKSITLRQEIGLTELYNLINTRNVSISGSIINDLNQVRELHCKLDEAVLTSYGWNDILLKHEFYEIDFLPENDRIRFSIHPDARKEILKRLFILNQQLYIDEKSKNSKIKTKSKKFINRENHFPKLF